MAIPADNWNFQKGDLSGYTHQGRVGVAQELRGLVNRKYLPFSSPYMAYIDDPWSADSTDGTRTQSRNLAPAWDGGGLQIPNRDGTLTFAGDGAYLECPQVVAQRGQQLCFWYVFIGCDSLDCNDFALLELRPPGAAPERVLICDIQMLERLNPGKPTQSREWVQFVYPFAQDFSGDVRWVVCNGKVGLPGSAEALAWPSSLLLDNIQLL